MALVGFSAFAISAITAAIYDGKIFPHHASAPSIPEIVEVTVVETVNYHIPFVVYEQVPASHICDVPRGGPNILHCDCQYGLKALYALWTILAIVAVIVTIKSWFRGRAAAALPASPDDDNQDDNDHTQLAGAGESEDCNENSPCIPSGGAQANQLGKISPQHQRAPEPSNMTRHQPEAGAQANHDLSQEESHSGDQRATLMSSTGGARRKVFPRFQDFYVEEQQERSRNPREPIKSARQTPMKRPARVQRKREAQSMTFAPQEEEQQNNRTRPENSTFSPYAESQRQRRQFPKKSESIHGAIAPIHALDDSKDIESLDRSTDIEESARDSRQPCMGGSVPGTIARLDTRANDTESGGNGESSVGHPPDPAPPIEDSHGRMQQQVYGDHTADFFLSSPVGHTPSTSQTSTSSDLDDTSSSSSESFSGLSAPGSSRLGETQAQFKEDDVEDFVGHFSSPNVAGTESDTAQPDVVEVQEVVETPTFATHPTESMSALASEIEHIEDDSFQPEVDAERQRSLTPGVNEGPCLNDVESPQTSTFDSTDLQIEQGQNTSLEQHGFERSDCTHLASDPNQWQTETTFLEYQAASPGYSLPQSHGLKSSASQNDIALTSYNPAPQQLDFGNRFASQRYVETTTPQLEPYYQGTAEDDSMDTSDPQPETAIKNDVAYDLMDTSDQPENEVRNGIDHDSMEVNDVQPQNDVENYIENDVDMGENDEIHSHWDTQHSQDDVHKGAQLSQQVSTPSMAEVFQSVPSYYAPPPGYYNAQEPQPARPTRAPTVELFGSNEESRLPPISDRDDLDRAIETDGDVQRELRRVGEDAGEIESLDDQAFWRSWNSLTPAIRSLFFDDNMLPDPMELSSDDRRKFVTDAQSFHGTETADAWLEFDEEFDERPKGQGGGKREAEDEPESDGARKRRAPE